MKVLVFLACLILLALAIWALHDFFFNSANGIKRALQRRKQQTGLWRLSEESDEEQIVVYCIEPGTERKLLVGAAAFAAPDFDMQIEYVRSEARQKLITLNSERKSLR